MRQRRAPAADDESALPDLGAPIQLRRHARARRMTLRVSRTRRTIIVTLPLQCDLGEASSFIHRHQDWVRERLGSLPDRVPFRDGSYLPLRGEMHRLAATAPSAPGSIVSAHVGDDDIPELRVRGHADHFARRLTDWLVEEARRDLDARVGVHCSSLGLRAHRIAVRDQASRWGSCSTTGVLSFSWRLVMAPPMVLDYVAAHEVAHLAEMNHGPRFWALVRKAMPAMDDARSWLTRHGTELHGYGPARK